VFCTIFKQQVDIGIVTILSRAVMSRASSLRQVRQSQSSSTQELFPGTGHTLQNNHDNILHHSSQNPRTVTHNQLENAKGTKLVGAVTIAGDIGIENDPAACAPSRTHNQFKGASDVHLSSSLAISGNISSSGAMALASMLAALQGELVEVLYNLSLF